MEDFCDKSAQENAQPSPDHEKPSVASVPQKTMAYSILCLVLSLLSIVCCCSGFISLVFAAVSIAFAIVSRKHLGYFDSISIIGLVVAIMGVVFSLFMIAVWIYSFVQGNFFWEYNGQISPYNFQFFV